MALGKGLQMDGGAFFPGDGGRKTYIIIVINWIFGVLYLPVSNITYSMHLCRMHKMGQI